MLHRMNSISNIDRCRSESATVFILLFRPGYIPTVKKKEYFFLKYSKMVAFLFLYSGLLFSAVEAEFCGYVKFLSAKGAEF